jgi:nucleotide-binding universal stress UspA family protein
MSAGRHGTLQLNRIGYRLAVASTIVCAVDADDGESRRPLLVADDLARRLRRTLVVAHVALPGFLSAGGPAGAEHVVVGPAPTVPFPYPVVPAAEFEEVRRAARRRIDELLAGCGVKAAEVEVAVHPTVADGLRDVAAARDAELLIVGSRGRGTVQAALLGSTSHALAADAPCPVVIVHASA